MKREPAKCPSCGRIVARNADNKCAITDEYFHTRCWLAMGPLNQGEPVQSRTSRTKRRRKESKA